LSREKFFFLTEYVYLAVTTTNKGLVRGDGACKFANFLASLGVKETALLERLNAPAPIFDFLVNFFIDKKSFFSYY
jgi:hypothetical protein